MKYVKILLKEKSGDECEESKYSRDIFNDDSDMSANEDSFVFICIETANNF